jgi:DNA-binding XRE family transcriptional regulator
MSLHWPIRRYWNQHNPRIDGRKVRQLRLEAGMTQKELAEAIGVSDRAIRMWETEEGPMRNAGNIAFKLARVFGVDSVELCVRRQPASRR